MRAERARGGGCGREVSLSPPHHSESFLHFDVNGASAYARYFLV